MSIKKLELREDQYLELEKLGFASFMPVLNFMEEETFVSVCEHMQLPSGEIFPLPIILDISSEIAQGIDLETQLILVYQDIEVGNILVESLFTCEKEKVATLLFGTSDANHPGVNRFYKQGDWFIGGKTEFWTKVETEVSKYEMTPKQSKKIFEELGWKKVVGFQTRNVPHRAHEYLQRVALEHADGLFIQPLVGQKKNGDYTPEAIMTGYQALVQQFYPKTNVVLGTLSTSMRYAGPREAIFHAIVRRNYGCTHFIIGRDHAGVGNYYGKYEAQELAKTVQDKLGIEIMHLHGPFYCSACQGIVTEHTCRHYTENPEVIQEISGTMIRQMLRGGIKPDLNFFRQEVLDAIKDSQLFIEVKD